MINTVWGSTDRPVSSKQLATLLASRADLEGTLYIGYPIIGTPEGSFPIDALLLSASKGLVLFNLIEGKAVGDYETQQDEAFNKLQAKLLQHQSLIKKRQLLVKIHTVTFAPAVANIDASANDDHLICSVDSLLETVDQLEDSDPTVFKSLVAVIQAITTLRRGRKKRELHSANSKGAKIKSLEDSIANLDTQQSAAVVETFDGVQRIRGLAGSGKTIVLALKVAYLHARHPEWLIAVTFNTRSLKKQFENLITSFVLEQTNEEPDWDKVRIMNAWGAPGGKDRSGIYYEFCQDHGVEYYDFRSAGQFGPDRQFEGACDVALQSAKGFNPKYDAILVDEAQDFSPNFLLLCYEYLKPPKRLVYAYDELQNLGKGSLPSVEEIFGSNSNGNPRVTLRPEEPGQPKQEIILDVCYRNSRPVLSTAHALGFGVYREQGGLVQIFENKSLWLDIGYEIKDGELEDGHNVSLSRTPKSSPAFLENHSTIDDLIALEVFPSDHEQAKWLVDAIERNLKVDELLPDDIVVINPDPISTRNAVAEARKMLLERGINSNLAGVTSSVDVFSEPGSVTFTGVFRAKGNEAAMVYVINAQDCFTAFFPRDRARVRNRLFTAITRSKAWVRVLGVGKYMEALKSEFNRTRETGFELRFKYPTEKEREEMTIVNRDMSKEEKERFAKKQNNLVDIIESLESGETFIEDYPENVIRKLQKLLEKKSKTPRR